MAEVSDAELAELRGAHRLLDAVLKNPETKDEAFKIMKKINPKANIPEYDLKQSVSKDVQATNERIAKLEKMLTDRDEDREFNARFDAATAKYGITDDARPKVHALMVERKIADPEAGALLFNNLNPPPPTSTSSGWLGATMFDDSKDSELGQWIDNPEKMRDAAINEIFGQRRAA